MKPVVVDASVVAAALFAEPLAARATRILTSRAELHVPDLFYAEIGSVIWKRVRRRELNGDEAEEMMADVLRLPLRVTPTRELAADALRLAIESACTAYDCAYLALAVRRGAAMVTADRRMARLLVATPLERTVRLLGERL